VSGRLAAVGRPATLGPPTAGTRLAPLDPLAMVDRGDYLVVYRHGVELDVPAHRVDHAAHLRALADLGCDRVLGVSSVGSLHPDLAVGTVVVPDDFIALDSPPVVADEANQHVVPGFSPAWRAEVLAAWRRVASRTAVDGGVYWQTNGPRFETPAEVRLAAGAATIIGMTMASECVAANQVGLAYAGVCVVDNLANGIADVTLTVDDYRRGAAENAAALRADLEAILGELAS
jgi:5'-methylthioadenosine phosphorylase